MMRTLIAAAPAPPAEAAVLFGGEALGPKS